ncbi:MAG: hypothetical protein E6J03_07530, partial [Chloroflexi bacterium]
MEEVLLAIVSCDEAESTIGHDLLDTTSQHLAVSTYLPEQRYRRARVRFEKARKRRATVGPTEGRLPASVPRRRTPPRSASRYPVAGMRFAHVTDVHLSVDRGDPQGGLEFTARHGDGTEVVAALDAAFTHAAGRGAGLALVTGDLTEHGTTAELRRFAARATAAPLPVWTVPGNHDHYGHLHEPDPADRPRGGGFLGSATVRRYEAVLGPRWWSRDHGSLHVVGLDWFSALCGIDAEEQRDFLAADLGPLPGGTQVLLLSHDQLDPGWFDHVRDVAPQVRVIGALSGHCHSPKLVTDDG